MPFSGEWTMHQTALTGSLVTLWSLNLSHCVTPSLSHVYSLLFLLALVSSLFLLPLCWLLSASSTYLSTPIYFALSPVPALFYLPSLCPPSPFFLPSLFLSFLFFLALSISLSPPLFQIIPQHVNEQSSFHIRWSSDNHLDAHLLP